MTTNPHSADPVVELRGVDAGYGERLILSGIDFSVRRGQLVAVMGGSGSGKTTLLRLVSGQLRARKGSVRVFGQSLERISEKELYALRRRMGMLFQFGALFTDLSVFDNVAFPLREHTDLPESMIRDLVLLKLNAVGLRGAATLMPSELSGGMARRVALARSVALDPELIMYDEPFAGLDPISLGVIGQAIRKLNDALGAASILVTHDVVESLSIVDYVYLVSQGKIIAQGTPDEIRNSPDPFVHQFIYAEADGPVPFHYPAPPLEESLLLEAEVAP
ncbi:MULTISPECIES: ABC transporter ATP-binding protein [Tepidiphilus]|uniref:ABC transporter ATP-binding protein n=1 Tax=Tepidiphilus TaxID=203470 RepID=UPI0006E3C122|nr:MULTISPECIES: ABC transporter ATP-binding protein [Tepidiphilus]